MATRKRVRKDRVQLAFDLDAILTALEDSFIIKLTKYFVKLSNSFIKKAENLPMFQKALKDISEPEVKELKKLMNTYYKKIGKETIKQTKLELKELSGQSSRITVVNVPEALRMRADELAIKKLKDYRDTLRSAIDKQQGTLKDKAVLKAEIRSASKQFINRNVVIVSRMESVTVANQNRLEAFSQSKIIAGVQFLAVLDKRTTKICTSRHAMILKLSDPNLPNFTPPCHFGCRSLLSGVTIYEDFTYTDTKDLVKVPAKDFGKSNTETL